MHVLVIILYLFNSLLLLDFQELYKKGKKFEKNEKPSKNNFFISLQFFIRVDSYVYDFKS